MAYPNEAHLDDGNVRLSREQLQQIASHIQNVMEDEALCSRIGQPETDSTGALQKPPTPEQLTQLFQFLDEYYWFTATTTTEPTSSDDKESTQHPPATTKRKRPTLLTIGIDNALAAIMATRFNLCSQAIILNSPDDPTSQSQHDNSKKVLVNSKKLAFQQGVFEKVHFFPIEDKSFLRHPTLLLDNPHYMADRINQSNIIFVHAPSEEVMMKWIPLFALLSSKMKAKRKFITLREFPLPKEVAIPSRFMAAASSSSELCIYDEVIFDEKAKEETRNQQISIIPPPPKPLDGDEIDKEFARSSILHALPERF